MARPFYETERAIVDIHRADCLLTVKANCPETFAMPSTFDREESDVRHHHTLPGKGHGRIETRHIDALTVPGPMVSFAHARQAMRVTRERTELRTGEDASRIRARHAPANHATLNNIALAIVFHRGFHHRPDAQMH